MTAKTLRGIIPTVPRARDFQNDPLPIESCTKIVTRTPARSNVSVIPARVSGVREESRIPLEDVGKDRDSSRGSHARE